jgi:hypothetical protein
VYTSNVTVKTIWDNQMVVGPLPDTLKINSRARANKELFTVLAAMAAWGERWCGREVHIHTSAASKVIILVHGKTRDLAVLQIARGIWLLSAQLDVMLTPLDLTCDLEGEEPSVQRDIPQAALDVLDGY